MQSVWLCVSIPGVSLLVLFRDEEPDKISITQSPLLIHPPVPEEQTTQSVLETKTYDESFLKRKNNNNNNLLVMTSDLNSMTFFTYLVTVPENILSIILWEMAGKYETRDYLQSRLLDNSFLS